MSPAMRIATVGSLCTLGLLAGGCGNGGKAIVLNDASDFQAQVIESKQPALVMFFKGGCAACAALEPTFDALAGEYQGRAVVAKIMVLNLVFISPVPEIKDRYDIGLVPTVILFVNGQEKQRWVADYSKEKYEKALNEVVGGGPSQTTPAGGGTTRPGG